MGWLWGAITVRQLGAWADEARTYGNGTGHLTTRQDIQLHWLPLDAIPAVLQRLGDEGLITFQSGGNSVRNVAACPLAGACDKEVFDVTAHAAAVDDYYVGNLAVQNLPRKFKSSFSGCPADCALSAIQDFGAIAVQGSEDGSTVRGFRVYVGGGLGAWRARQCSSKTLSRKAKCSLRTKRWCGFLSGWVTVQRKTVPA